MLFRSDVRTATLRRVRYGGGWLLGVLLVASACSGGGGDGDSTVTSPISTYSFPTYSTRPAPSTPPVTTGANVRPGEKPPTLPPAAKKNTTAGALAFAKYWEQTIDWGYATVDSTLPRSAYSASCKGCERFMRQFDGARSKGLHFRGGRLTILDWALQPNDHHNGATAVVDVTFSAQALKVLDRTGQVIESDAAVPRMTDRVWVRWTGSRWTVVDSKRVVRK